MQANNENVQEDEDEYLNINISGDGGPFLTAATTSSSSSLVSSSSINQVGLNIQNRIRSEMAAAVAAAAAAPTAETRSSRGSSSMTMAAAAAAATAETRSLDRSRGGSVTTTATIQRRIAESDTLSERSKRFLTDYIERLEELIWVYSKSSEYYERRNFYITTPSIILTSVSSIVSLLSASNSTAVGGGANTFHYSSAVAVGVIAAVSSVFQALSSTLKYGTKCELHREVADRYSKIITSIHFEFIEHTDAHFITVLEQQILEVQNLCKYLPPMFLFEQYKKHLVLMGKCNNDNGV